MNPPVPADLDLRDFPYMPVDIVRLFGSGFHTQSDDSAWRAGMTLWLKSYHQVPASSIPDDDRDQAMLAELGKDVKTWRKIKESALRGWTKCSDGRLYHKVVSEKALEAWIEKLGQRKSSAAGNSKRYNQPFDASHFDEAIEDALGMLKALNPSSRILSKRLPKVSHQPPIGSPKGHPDPLPSGSQGKGRDSTASAVVESASRPKRARPRSKIEPGAQPMPADREAAIAAGLDEPRFRSEWQRFRDHHTAKGNLMADWSAAWRTWLGNIAQFQPKSIGAKDDEDGKSVHRAVRSLEASGFELGPKPAPYMPAGRGDSSGWDTPRMLPQGGGGGTGDLRRGGDVGLVLLSGADRLSGDGPQDGLGWQEPVASNGG